MLHLSHLLTAIERHHPEIVSDFLVDYCAGSDTPGPGRHYYGWGSLKWALSYIAQQDPDNVGLLFFNIICESRAKGMEDSYFQNGILKFHSLKNYKTALRDIEPIDVTALPYEWIASRKAVINTTGRGIAALILKKIPDAQVVISVHQGTHPTINLRGTHNRRSDQLLQERILDALGQRDGGWRLLTNPVGATLVNTLDIPVSPEQIIETISPILKN